MDLNRLEDAEKVYWNLIDRNSDNTFYYKQIEKCQGIGKNLLKKYLNNEIFKDNNTEKANQLKIKNIFEKSLITRPNASIPQLLTLFCLEGIHILIYAF